MEKLNKLVERSNEIADFYDNSIMVDRKTILAIAEAFRALEQEIKQERIYVRDLNRRVHEEQQRAEAAEAKLETEYKWRYLALQFDGHRMQALSLLKMIVNDAPVEQYQSVRNFLNSAPLSGEEVMKERLAEISTARPVPAINLAELVPEERPVPPFKTHQAGLSIGFNACRAAILRKIEESKC